MVTLRDEMEAEARIREAGIPTAEITHESDAGGFYLIKRTEFGPSVHTLLHDGQFGSAQIESLARIFVKARNAKLPIDSKPDNFRWSPKLQEFVLIDNGLIGLDADAVTAAQLKERGFSESDIRELASVINVHATTYLSVGHWATAFFTGRPELAKQFREAVNALDRTSPR
jgi:hypothetical protein